MAELLEAHRTIENLMYYVQYPLDQHRARTIINPDAPLEFAERALKEYLLIAYIDLNGPEKTLPGDEATFNKEDAFVEPRIISKASEMVRASIFDLSEVEAIFFEEVGPLADTYSLPVSLADGWAVIQTKLKDHIAGNIKLRWPRLRQFGHKWM
jgi:hypothetical protein